MKYHVPLFFFALLASTAQACPDLRGVYRCSENEQELIFIIDQKAAAGVTTYTMDAVMTEQTYTQVLIADGVTRERSGEFGTIRQSAHCVNDSLLTQYESVSSTGWGRARIDMSFELDPAQHLILKISDENIQGPERQASESTETCRRS